MAATEANAGSDELSNDLERHAQTTPDGRYLVFSSPRRFAGDATSCMTCQAAYRYDFNTGELTWLSHTAPAAACTASAGCTGNEGKDA